MNKEHEILFIKELKDLGVKTKDIKRLIHSFDIIEIVAFEINKNPDEIFASYNISKELNN